MQATQEKPTVDNLPRTDLSRSKNWEEIEIVEDVGHYAVEGSVRPRDLLKAFMEGLRSKGINLEAILFQGASIDFRGQFHPARLVRSERVDLLREGFLVLGDDITRLSVFGFGDAAGELPGLVSEKIDRNSDRSLRLDDVGLPIVNGSSVVPGKTPRNGSLQLEYLAQFYHLTDYDHERVYRTTVNLKGENRGLTIGVAVDAFNNVVSSSGLRLYKRIPSAVPTT